MYTAYFAISTRAALLSSEAHHPSRFETRKSAAERERLRQDL